MSMASAVAAAASVVFAFVDAVGLANDDGNHCNAYACDDNLLYHGVFVLCIVAVSIVETQPSPTSNPR